MVDRQRQLEDLLLQAPPGQVIEVYKSLKTIAPDADLTAAVDKWNRKSLKCADNGIILSDHTAISPDVWLNYLTNTLFSLDSPLSVKASPINDTELPELPKGNQTLQTALDAYLSSFFSGAGGASACAALDTEQGIVLQIVNNLSNPDSFWMGRWSSEYLIQGDKLSGHASVIVHFYEDGNVQMNVHESIEDAVTVDASDPSGVVKAISEFESGVQAKVGKEFSLLTEEVFKNMRRILPVFRSKIKWETIAGYKIKGELNEQK